ncbi:hypothetical protein Alvin_3301 (plasmid) [Allochromatium vinosum DSM 180]|uniref:Uncharacterized protein n=1 Tax=Allochromatium vinosum (strain ATCC 17899 / DSM 180 / NBRC 103801 / NCIMB 10441 / D) TaxID=572477 RepID=D3RWH9_ALLVD|nr:hypothetical protein Alvin_3301 [Allochromatium vinosum DSM 180]
MQTVRARRLGLTWFAVLLGVLILVLAITGCAMADPALDTDPVACERAGGQIKRVCLAQQPMCVIPYPDAGRPCRDASECAGYCLASFGAQIGERVQGTCEHDNNPCGCRSYVENGRVVDGRCVD